MCIYYNLLSNQLNNIIHYIDIQEYFGKKLVLILSNKYIYIYYNSENLVSEIIKFSTY